MIWMNVMAPPQDASVRGIAYGRLLAATRKSGCAAR
jgi:hypothetical protein